MILFRLIIGMREIDFSRGRQSERSEIRRAKFAKRSTRDTRKTKGLIPYSISYSWTSASLTSRALLNMLVDIRRVPSQFMPLLIATAAELRKPTQRMLRITLGLIFDECETRLQFESCIENKRMTARMLLCRKTMVTIRRLKHFFCYVFLTMF